MVNNGQIDFNCGSTAEELMKNLLIIIKTIIIMTFKDQYGLHI